MVGFFLALLLIDLFLNEYLLLGKIFELFPAFVVFLPSEGFVGGVGYLCIRIGDLLDGFLIYLAVVAHPGEHPRPCVAVLLRCEVLAQYLLRRFGIDVSQFLYGIPDVIL